MRAVSKKRMKLVRERRKVLARIMGGPCEARLDGCTGRAEDPHEVLSRARGGSLIDPANILPVCRPCHEFITTHPKDATERGLLKARWPK